MHHISFNIARIREHSRLVASPPCCSKGKGEFSLLMLWKAALKHRMRAGLKSCPGLGLLIVSSVLAKSAGCDSRPLSVTRLTTGFGILSAHLPYHRLHRISILASHSPQSLCSKNEDQRLGVKEEECRLTVSDCGLTSVGSGCWLRFVGFREYSLSDKVTNLHFKCKCVMRYYLLWLTRMPFLWEVKIFTSRMLFCDCTIWSHSIRY